MLSDGWRLRGGRGGEALATLGPAGITARLGIIYRDSSEPIVNALSLYGLLQGRVM